MLDGHAYCFLQYVRKVRTRANFIGSRVAGNARLKQFTRCEQRRFVPKGTKYPLG